MGGLASELLARALRATEPASEEQRFQWIRRDLGAPLVDLEDKEAVRAALDGRR